MRILQDPKKVALWNKQHFEEKKTKCSACLKNSVRIFVVKIHKMGCLEGSGVPVLYIGRTVPKGQYTFTFTNTLHVSGVKRPSSGGTTLAVFLCEFRALLAVGWLRFVGWLVYWAWGCWCRSGGLVGCDMKVIGPQLSTSQQLQLHTTHTKNC
jgi:hypothetical protein